MIPNTPEKALATLNTEGIYKVYFPKFDRITNLHGEDYSREYIRQCLVSLFSLEAKLFSQLELASFKYYQDVEDCIGRDYLDKIINSATEIWQHVRPMYIYLERSQINPDNTFLAVTLSCDWDEEHGLFWLIKNTDEVMHVSPAGEYCSPDNKLSYQDGNYAGN